MSYFIFRSKNSMSVVPYGSNAPPLSAPIFTGITYQEIANYIASKPKVFGLSYTEDYTRPLYGISGTTTPKNERSYFFSSRLFSPNGNSYADLGNIEAIFTVYQPDNTGRVAVRDEAGRSIFVDANKFLKPEENVVEVDFSYDFSGQPRGGEDLNNAINRAVKHGAELDLLSRYQFLLQVRKLNINQAKLAVLRELVRIRTNGKDNVKNILEAYGRLYGEYLALVKRGISLPNIDFISLPQTRNQFFSFSGTSLLDGGDLRDFSAGSDQLWKILNDYYQNL